jgi:hypothetical protein
MARTWQRAFLTVHIKPIAQLESDAGSCSRSRSAARHADSFETPLRSIEPILAQPH